MSPCHEHVSTPSHQRRSDISGNGVWASESSSENNPGFKNQVELAGKLALGVIWTALSLPNVNCERECVVKRSIRRSLSM